MTATDDAAAKPRSWYDRRPIHPRVVAGIPVYLSYRGLAEFALPGVIWYLQVDFPKRYVGPSGSWAWLVVTVMMSVFIAMVIYLAAFAIRPIARAVAARLVGARVEGIDLNRKLGTQVDSSTLQGWQLTITALAAPLANLLLAALFTLGGRLVTTGFAPSLLLFGVHVNLLVGVVTLIPIVGTNGGDAVLGAVTAITGSQRIGERVVGVVGCVASLLIAWLALFPLRGAIEGLPVWNFDSFSVSRWVVPAILVFCAVGFVASLMQFIGSFGSATKKHAVEPSGSD